MKQIDSCAHVELSTLSALATEMPPVERWLSDDEQHRLASIASKQRRQQFLGGHWLLRRLVAEVYGGEPLQWLLLTGPDRAPLLRSQLRPDESAVHASLSHSGDWLAVAIAVFPVGIDLERPGKPRDLLALADRMFSPDERAELRGLPDNERAAAFFLYWTIKESLGKRTGHGLQSQLAQRQQPLACAAEDASVHTWQFADCSLALAGKTAMSVRAINLPDAATPRYWRIESA
jgi:4'-phosphopantetheinyl transferase